MNTFSLALLATLASAPLAAWADANPDFDDDAKPILRMQPGLVQYVEERFEVKDTGTAKFPGSDDRPPAPPFIFRARPMGSHGPYNLRLLIQPGEPGHILGVVDITKVRLHEPPAAPSGPEEANQPPPSEPPPQAAEAPASVQVPELSAGPVDQQPLQQPTTTPQKPTPAQQPSTPTSDTPSGPIPDSNSPSEPLAPPPDANSSGK